MKRINLATLSIFIFFLGSCASSPKPLPPLNGMIYDYDNVPVASAIVSVEGKRETLSDVNGRFALPNYLSGKYAIRVQRDGYEPAQVTIDYTSPTQILYIKMISVDQLLTLAEKAFEQRDWQSTDVYLQRAQAIQPQSIPLRYMLAALYFRRGNVPEALRTLDLLLADEVSDPSVHLFIADLYQYRLGDNKAALRHLEVFLNLRYDPEVINRRDELRLSLTP